MGDRSPYSMATSYIPDLLHVRILGPQVQAFLSPQEREGKLVDRTRAGRYVGHADSGNTCVISNEKSNRPFTRGLAEVVEYLDETQRQMNKMLVMPPDDDSFIDNVVSKLNLSCFPCRNVIMRT